MTVDKELLDSARSGPRRAGRKELITHLEGGKISRPGAVKAKCYDCDGMGDSGECNIPACPLYSFSPYRTRNRAVSAKSEVQGSLDGGNLSQTHIGKSQNEKETIIEDVEEEI